MPEIFNFIYRVARIQTSLLRPIYILNYSEAKLQIFSTYYSRYGEIDYMKKISSRNPQQMTLYNQPYGKEKKKKDLKYISFERTKRSCNKCLIEYQLAEYLSIWLFLKHFKSKLKFKSKAKFKLWTACSTANRNWSTEFLRTWRVTPSLKTAKVVRHSQ